MTNKYMRVWTMGDHLGWAYVDDRELGGLLRSYTPAEIGGEGVEAAKEVLSVPGGFLPIGDDSVRPHAIIVSTGNERVAKELSTVITSKEAGEDPPIVIYHVEIKNETGVWTETFGSRAELDAFVKGLKAAAEMAGAALRIDAALLDGASWAPWRK